MKYNPCTRCKKHSGLQELCRVKSERPITYKAECLAGKSELRLKIFAFLFKMKRGGRVDIVNDEQRLHVFDFVQLHGFNEGVSLTEDNNTVYKHKFLTKDYESNSK